MKTRKIRMKTRYANGTLAIEPDQVGVLPEAEAKDLIEKGFAVDVDEDPSHGAAKPALKRNPRRRPPAGAAGKGAQPPAGDDPPADDPPDGGDDPDGDEGDDPDGE
jgi:hypothetical protein